MREDLLSSLGLKFNPFSASANSEGYFHTQGTDLALKELFYGIESRKGFLLLSGEVGVGKTSLLLQLLAELERNGIPTAWIFNTLLDKRELLLTVAKDFGLPLSEDASLSVVIDGLHQFFLKHNETSSNCVIIIDEAHNLSDEAMESLRMLSNLESGGRKLVQILLSGQPELVARLGREQLRQLRSRICIFKELAPLNAEETQRYVTFKLSIAGGHVKLSSRAISLLWNATKGNIRLINLVMERALYGLVAYNGQEITAKIMEEAVREIGKCQTELMAGLNTTRKKDYLRLAGWASATALVLSIGAFLIWPKLFGPTRGGAQTPQLRTEETRPTAKAAATPRTSTQPSKQPKADFLTVFHLESLAGELDSSLAQGVWEPLVQRLPRDLDLFATDQKPTKTYLLYAILPWRAFTGRSPEYLILWRPAYRITTFHRRYQGPEILGLQQDLSRLGYYGKNMDGMVGAATWQALDTFQRDAGLTRSGRPDTETLFSIAARIQSLDPKMNQRTPPGPNQKGDQP